MIFNFYIYDRRGKCLYYKEWNRPLNTLADDPQEEKKTDVWYAVFVERTDFENLAL